MKRDQVEQRVVSALADILAVDRAEVRLDSRIRDDFGASSLDLVQLLWTLEEEIGEEIPDDVLDSVETTGDIVDYLTVFLAERGR